MCKFDQTRLIDQSGSPHGRLTSAVGEIDNQLVNLLVSFDRSNVG